eukprot:SAG31_NODE_3682_length_3992_cov_2.502954_2_plen_118_part_00
MQPAMSLSHCWSAGGLFVATGSGAAAVANCVGEVQVGVSAVRGLPVPLLERQAPGRSPAPTVWCGRGSRIAVPAVCSPQPSQVQRRSLRTRVKWSWERVGWGGGVGSARDLAPRLAL